MNQPLFKVFLLFSSGIILQNLFPLDFNFNLILLCTALITVVVFFILKRYYFKHQSAIKDGLIMFSVFLLGTLVFKNASGELHDYKQHFKENIYHSYSGRINSVPIFKDERASFVIETENFYYDELGKEPVNGDIKVWVQAKEGEVNYGDILLFNSRINKIKNRGNPGEFDYAGFMNKKGVSYQAFVTKDSYFVLEKGSNFFIRSALKTRNFLLKKIEKYFTLESNGVAKALLLGYKTDIDNETRTHYASSGASHILAVSGMHVGIVILILNWINKVWARSKRTKSIAILISIALIWFYVFITGFSPSILRAGLMFTFFAAAKLLHRDYNSVNILAASAIVLLIYNPHYLFDLGFQLSYVAVLGIVMVYPKMKSWVFTRSKIINWAWQLSAVSISAQIATFPITVFYFHKFPVLFLLTNIVTTVLATLILITGFVFSIFNFIDVIAHWFAFLCAHLIEWMNSFVAWVNTLTFASIKGIYWNEYQLLIMLVVSSIPILVRSEQFKVKVWLAGITIVLISFMPFLRSENDPRNELIVMNSSKELIYTFKSSGATYYFRENKDEGSSGELESYWNSFENGKKIDISEMNDSQRLRYQNDIVFVQDFSLIRLTEQNKHLLNEFKFDFVIYDGKAFLDPNEIRNGFWILAGKLSSARKNFITGKLIHKHIPWFDTSTKAFKKKF